MSESSSEQEENGEEGYNTPRWLFALFLLGFVLLLLGAVIAGIASLAKQSSASGSVVIFVGPIPIVFGAGPGATWLVLIGIILTVISVILVVVTRRKRSRNED